MARFQRRTGGAPGFQLTHAASDCSMQWRGEWWGRTPPYGLLERAGDGPADAVVGGSGGAEGNEGGGGQNGFEHDVLLSVCDERYGGGGEPGHFPSSRDGLGRW